MGPPSFLDFLSIVVRATKKMFLSSKGIAAWKLEEILYMGLVLNPMPTSVGMGPVYYLATCPLGRVAPSTHECYFGEDFTKETDSEVWRRFREFPRVDPG